jgi:hypothetical protein
MTLDDLQQAAIEQRAIASSLAHVEAALTPFRANLLAELLAAQSASLTTSLIATTDRLVHLENAVAPLLIHPNSNQRSIDASLAHVDAVLAPFRANLLAELQSHQESTIQDAALPLATRITNLEETIAPLLAHLDSSLAATQRDLSLARHDAAQSMVTKVMTDPRFQDALITLLAERQAATAPHEEAPSHG